MVDKSKDITEREGLEPLAMPSVAEDMQEAVLVEWHVKPDQDFAEGDVLFEIETDKATMEIEADSDGTLREILVPVGETAQVGSPLAWFERR